MSDLLLVFRTGRGVGGWCCFDCHRAFHHNGRPRWTYARVAAHMLRRHGRLPRRVAQRCVLFEWHYLDSGEAS